MMKLRVFTSLLNRRPLLSCQTRLVSSKFTAELLTDSTRAQILNCYQASVAHVETLLAEKDRLSDLTRNEAELNAFADKQEVFQRLGHLNSIAQTYEQILKADTDARDLAEMLTVLDEADEFSKVLAEDLKRLEIKKFDLKTEIIQQLIPEEVEDRENALVELNAGVGGVESGLFCAELYAMYEAYAGYMGWTFNPVTTDTETNMYSEVMRKSVFEIVGNEAYKHFKFESGVHRVQRVPLTDSKGRIHTSTVGVVVTPKPEKINIELNPKDLKIETKTSGGPGGQHANKTLSAVRLTHLPTGIVIYSDGERHMMQNRQQAMDNLLQKLYQIAFEEQLNRRQQNRKTQVGSSSRSSRIRTYNFIQDRVTDHRLGENFIGVGRFLAGEGPLNRMVQNLIFEQQVEAVNEMLESKNEKHQT